MNCGTRSGIELFHTKVDVRTAYEHRSSALHQSTVVTQILETTLQSGEVPKVTPESPNQGGGFVVKFSKIIILCQIEVVIFGGLN